jgi:hypothetical protein
MKTATFDENLAIKVEDAVCAEFGFNKWDVVGFPDAYPKKVVVFVLFRFLGFEDRKIGKAYQMTYLYVPTVVAHIGSQYECDSDFRFKIYCVLKSIGYGKIMDVG